ncbi:MAG TPA: hypothetical protein VHC40_01800 [Rhizomicrobium sp.]|jgi:hypothetical protein|nr:hypothetical protein [Rhizomicrobium sp.]
MRNLELLLFAVAGGLAVSGIVANLYRLLAGKPKSLPANIVYYAVMVLAGPSVLFENSTRSFRKKACSGIAYFVAVAIAGYWAFALGLLAIQIDMALR